MIAWFRRLLRIVHDYEADQKRLYNNIAFGVDLIKQRTEIAADVSPRGPCTIILIGRYRHADYVQTVCLEQPAFEHLVETLRSMQRSGHLQYVDCPPNLRGTIKRAAQL